MCIFFWCLLQGRHNPLNRPGTVRMLKVNFNHKAADRTKISIFLGAMPPHSPYKKHASHTCPSACFWHSILCQHCICIARCLFSSAGWVKLNIIELHDNSQTTHGQLMDNSHLMTSHQTQKQETSHKHASCATN